MEEHQSNQQASSCFISDGQPALHPQFHNYHLNYNAPILGPVINHCNTLDNHHRQQLVVEGQQPVARPPSAGPAAPSSTTNGDLHAPADQRPLADGPRAIAHGSHHWQQLERPEDYQDYAHHNHHQQHPTAAALEVAESSNALYQQQQNFQRYQQASTITAVHHPAAAAVVPYHAHHLHYHENPYHTNQQPQHAAYLKHQQQQQHLEIQNHRYHQQFQQEPGRLKQLKDGGHYASQHQFAVVFAAPSGEANPEVAQLGNFSPSTSNQHYQWPTADSSGVATNANAIGTQPVAAHSLAEPHEWLPNWRPCEPHEKVDWWSQKSFSSTNLPSQQEHFQSDQQQYQAPAAVCGGPASIDVASTPAARPPSGLCTSSSQGRARPRGESIAHPAGEQKLLSNGQKVLTPLNIKQRQQQSSTKQVAATSSTSKKRATGSKGGGRLVTGPNGIVARRKNATRETTAMLKEWLDEHGANPYPTKGEKIMLSIITKMSLTQVSTWFANARRRMKKENKALAWATFNGPSSSSVSVNNSTAIRTTSSSSASTAFKQLLNRNNQFIMAARPLVTRPNSLISNQTNQDTSSAASHVGGQSRADCQQEEQAQISTTTTTTTPVPSTTSGCEEAKQEKKHETLD